MRCRVEYSYFFLFLRIKLGWANLENEKNFICISKNMILMKIHVYLERNGVYIFDKFILIFFYKCEYNLSLSLSWKPAFFNSSWLDEGVVDTVISFVIENFFAWNRNFKFYQELYNRIMQRIKQSVRISIILVSFRKLWNFKDSFFPSDVRY